jgi:AbrB family looped-hinge helix DNA binding protein
MFTATMAEEGQVVIPAELRVRHGLTAGTELTFVDDDGGIRLLVRRRLAPSEPAAGYGMVKVPPRSNGKPRRLLEFDPARPVT